MLGRTETTNPVSRLPNHSSRMGRTLLGAGAVTLDVIVRRRAEAAGILRR